MATETFCRVSPPPLISASDINEMFVSRYLIMHLDTYADDSCNFVGGNKNWKIGELFIITAMYPMNSKQTLTFYSFRWNIFIWVHV